jgi:hypothetical protein
VLIGNQRLFDSCMLCSKRKSWKMYEDQVSVNLRNPKSVWAWGTPCSCCKISWLVIVHLLGWF